MNKRDNDEDDAQASKKARLFDDDANNNAIPIFLRKTYKMIDACNPEICSWSDDGEMFVVKQPVSWLGPAQAACTFRRAVPPTLF